MTSDDHPLSGHDSSDALAAYLVRVDMQLARTGLDIAERDSICRQIVEEFHDLLPVPLENATASQVDAALTKLGSDAAFASDDVASRGQMLRMLWHRFWIGTPIPLALNDHGRKRIMWAELLKRLGWLYVLAMSATLVPALMLLGKPTLGWFLFFAVYTVMLPLLIALKLLRAPVESLPRAEHWPANRVERHRFTGVLVIVGSFVFVSALVPGLYCLVATLARRSLWPVDQTLLLAVMLTLAGLSMFTAFSEAWRRRHRRRQFQRWAEGSVG